MAEKLQFVEFRPCMCNDDCNTYHMKQRNFVRITDFVTQFSRHFAYFISF